MQVDDEFKIISDAYPYIASRLLTDPSVELQAALEQVDFVIILYYISNDSACILLQFTRRVLVTFKFLAFSFCYLVDRILKLLKVKAKN